MLLRCFSHFKDKLEESHERVKANQILLLIIFQAVDEGIEQHVDLIGLDQGMVQVCQTLEYCKEFGDCQLIDSLKAAMYKYAIELTFMLIDHF